MPEITMESRKEKLIHTLATMFDYLGLAGTFRIEDKGQKLEVKITSDDAGRIIGRKGQGYGREALKLLIKWTFELKIFHRIWIDCKEYNSVALHLYESLGFVREGLLREILLTNDVYENLVVLGMLDREYFGKH